MAMEGLVILLAGTDRAHSDCFRPDQGYPALLLADAGMAAAALESGTTLLQKRLASWAIAGLVKEWLACHCSGDKMCELA
jgi:hypothetical protein